MPIAVPQLSGEQLPVPLGDDLDGAFAHLDGGLVIDCVGRSPEADCPPLSLLDRIVSVTIFD
jgi:hypothetical protein